MSDRITNKIVYTIGHSNRDLDEFIKILKKYGIKIVIDVRRFPTSKKYPWYNRDFLKKALLCQQIRYVWLGDLLGGYRTGGYEHYMNSENFRNGINKLINLIKEGETAIMCSERFWFRCHRRFISDVLKYLGFNIIHIIDFDRLYRHKKIRSFTLE